MITWRPVLAPERPDHERAIPGLPPFARRERSRHWRLAVEVPMLALAAVLIAFTLKTFIAQAFFIPSGSMEPQLLVGDRVVVSKLAYRFHDPHRGDVIVFDSPEPTVPDDDPWPVDFVNETLEVLGLRQPEDEEFIKRVVALPGETVEGRGNAVYVDGRKLIEPYLPEGVVISDFPPVVVPPEHLWVMGDNRANSRDSRMFGPIPEDDIVGRAVFKVWPPLDASFL